MKLTKRQLKNIIKEEKQKLLSEMHGRQSEDASFALEALLDSFVNENINHQSSGGISAEEANAAFDMAAENLREWFESWLDNMYDQNYSGE